MRLALDLGTTSLAGRLVDEEGQLLAERQVLNPQVEFGSDVLRRLEMAQDGYGSKLQGSLVAGINGLVDALLRDVEADAGDIGSAAAAGNPAISTLLQNLPPDPILSPPYRPSDCSAVFLTPGQFGINLNVPLYLFPLVNGFVGGDLVAFLFGQVAPEKPTLYVDIGTNGELALFSDGKWWVTSVAAGPAFEGGEIASGMMYGPGAVTGCRVEGDRFVLTVFGDGAPRGICGSGLAEAIAAALEASLIDRRGSIVSPEDVENNLSRYVVEERDGLSLQLYRDAGGDVRLEQKDIRAFQLAKAAVLAGVECLVEKAGIDGEEIAEVVMAGAFGFSLSKQALKRVAILPANMVDKVRFEASGVLTGVCRMLMLDHGPEEVEKNAGKLKPCPLSGTPRFEKAFIKSIDF